MRHDGVDSYSRSLITLMDARLTDFLSKMGGGVPDENACRECSGVLEDLSGGDADADVLVSLAIDDGSGGERAAASSAILASGVASWRRVVAHLGGASPLVEIYSNNFSHSSGGQRGLVQCLQHDCRRHIVVVGDRRMFCAYMFAWVLDGSSDEFLLDACAHRTHVPSDECVSFVLEHLVLTAF